MRRLKSHVFWNFVLGFLYVVFALTEGAPFKAAIFGFAAGACITFALLEVLSGYSISARNQLIAEQARLITQLRDFNVRRQRQAELHLH